MLKQCEVLFFKKMNKGIFFSVLLSLAIVILFVLNLALGSVSIPCDDVLTILLGNGEVKESWRYIVLESRLPQAITALLAGSSLAVSGLLLQTAFRNPLAGPDVFGISSGAGLAVALVMLGSGGNLSLGDYTMGGFMAVLVSALMGAMVVMGIIIFFSSLVRSHVVLLIVGIMIGYLASSVVSLLNFFATAEGVKSYMVWGMGSFGNVSMGEVPWLVVLSLVGLLMSLLLVKPLNALLLGERYAANLGFNIRHLRLALLLVTGLLTAVITAFCGPIAFIGLATPHIARLLLTTANHRQLLPVTLLMGAVIALLCNLLCCLPSENGILPLNAITPLFGAPIIIYVSLKFRS